MLYCTDDGNHTVRKFTPKGKLLMTLGTMDQAADTGYDGKDYMTITKPSDGFNRPTNLAVGPKGDLYVSDGYGNCRVHQFGPDGARKRSWGVPGTGPGQFYLPHGISVATDGRVFVCDRENDRIQIFSPDGEYLTEWTDTQRPTHLVFDPQGRAYVSELWWHKGDKRPRQGRTTDQPLYGRVSVFDKDGRLLTRWGTPEADRTRQLRGAARHRGRLARGHLRRGGRPGRSRRAAVACPRGATPSRSSRSRAEGLRPHRDPLLRLIGLFKLVKGVILLAAGVGAVYLSRDGAMDTFSLWIGACTCIRATAGSSSRSPPCSR